MWPYYVCVSSEGSGETIWIYRLQGSHRLENYLNLEGTHVRSSVKWSLFPRPWPELSYMALLCVCEQRRLRWDCECTSSRVHTGLKSTWKSCTRLEKSLKFSVGIKTVDRDLNQDKTVVPLFGAANAAPNKGTTILYEFSCTNLSIIPV